MLWFAFRKKIGCLIRLIQMQGDVSVFGLGGFLICSQVNSALPEVYK